MTSLASLRVFWAALSDVLPKLIGRSEWQPPSWLAWIGGGIAQAGRYLAADAKRVGLVLLVLPWISFAL
jgi:hypothetical protein